MIVTNSVPLVEPHVAITESGVAKTIVVRSRPTDGASVAWVLDPAQAETLAAQLIVAVHPSEVVR